VPALFTKFDARAFLENEKWQVLPAKLAKAAKAEEERSATLATLAALAHHDVISLAIKRERLRALRAKQAAKQRRS
jgi:hypothetical protein